MQKVELSVLVGSNIVLLRKKLGISQKELAEKLNITTDSMMKIEKGTIAPKMGRLQEIADALQCSVAKLFIDENSEDLNDLALLIADNMRKISAKDRAYLTQLIDSAMQYMKNKD